MCHTDPKPNTQATPGAGAVSVELPAGVASAVVAPVAYTVQVHTSNVRGAGTSANVTLTLRGEHGHASSPHVLEKAATDFKRGAVDNFVVRVFWPSHRFCTPPLVRSHHISLRLSVTPAGGSDEGWPGREPRGGQVRATDLGAVTSVSIGHDNSGRAPSWHLNRVLVTAPGAQEVCFPCGRCVGAKMFRVWVPTNPVGFSG